VAHLAGRLLAGTLVKKLKAQALLVAPARASFFVLLGARAGGVQSTARRGLVLVLAVGGFAVASRLLVDEALRRDGLVVGAGRGSAGPVLTTAAATAAAAAAAAAVADAATASVARGWGRQRGAVLRHPPP
jgi:hypothetical protein